MPVGAGAEFLSQPPDQKTRKDVPDFEADAAWRKLIANCLQLTPAKELGKTGGSVELWRNYNALARFDPIWCDSNLSRKEFFEAVGWLDSAFAKSLLAVDSARRFRRCRVPALVLLAESDEVVPFKRSREFYEDLLKRRTASGLLISCVGRGHGTFVSAPELERTGIDDAVVEWISNDWRLELCDDSPRNFAIEFASLGVLHGK